MKITNLLKYLAISMVVFLAYTPGLASAANCDASSGTAKNLINSGIDCANGGTPATAPANTLNNSITNVIDVISAVVGIAAVVMLIVAALRFVSSGGNAEAVKSAKNTALYAIVGLVIVAVAQTIVHFVLNRVVK